MLRLWMAAFVVTGLLAANAPVRADMESGDAEEVREAEEKVLKRDERDLERARAKERDLRRERTEIKADQRTNPPFKSQRTLRNELRTNEAKQGWQKRETRRLDYEVRRRQRNLQGRR